MGPARHEGLQQQIASQRGAGATQRAPWATMLSTLQHTQLMGLLYVYSWKLLVEFMLWDLRRFTSIYVRFISDYVGFKSDYIDLHKFMLMHVGLHI